MLLHTADVLVIDRRRCRVCGQSADVPSPTIHMMFRSVEGDPRKVALVPRKPEDAHHIVRTVRVHETEVASCLACWTSGEGDLLDYPTAEAFTPARPPLVLVLSKPKAPTQPIPSIKELI